MRLDELRSEVLKLPIEDRAELVHVLMLSLDTEEESHSENDQLWKEEIERRCRAIDEGNARLIPAEEVFARAEAALG